MKVSVEVSLDHEIEILLEADPLGYIVGVFDRSMGVREMRG